MRKKIKFVIFIILLCLIFYSFNVRNLHSYQYVYYDVYNFFPIFKNNTLLEGKNFNSNQENTIKNESQYIHNQNIESANFLATLFFSPTYFQYYRKSSRKGFTNKVIVNYKQGNFNFIIYNMEYIDKFYNKTTIKFKITKNIINFTHSILNTSGIKSYGEFTFDTSTISLKHFSLNINLFVFAVKKAVEDMIKNAVYIKYGRNFMYKVNGSFIMLEPPTIVINSGYIYFKILGYVVFNNEY